MVGAAARIGHDDSGIARTQLIRRLSERRMVLSQTTLDDGAAFGDFASHKGGHVLIFALARRRASNFLDESNTTCFGIGKWSARLEERSCAGRCGYEKTRSVCRSKKAGARWLCSCDRIVSLAIG